MSQFSRKVIEWQKCYGRHDLPWQQSYTPYRVWLSEIMLQQTQVKTVIVYYERFLKRCPRIEDLAMLPEDDLMKLWQGLGYYSRARYLHNTAKIIVNELGGVFPDTEEALVALPGIGPSTAAAILSLAYQKPAAILDGNVKRVLARFFGITQDISDAKVQKNLWMQARSLLPEKDARAYTQGLMDLGATCCKPRSPSCERCPLQRDCQAHLQDQSDVIPFKSKKVKVKKKKLYLMMYVQNGKVGLVKRESGIWNKLYTPIILEDEQVELLEGSQYLGGYRHQLTHLNLEIAVYMQQRFSSQPTRWVDIKDINLALPTGVVPAIALLLKVKKASLEVSHERI